MANKKRKKAVNRRRDLTAFIGTILILLTALGAEYFLGIDVLEEFDIFLSDDDGFPDTVYQERVSGDWYTLYFTQPINTSDRGDVSTSPLETDLINLIDSATTSIDGALFELNLESLANAFVRAQERGVEVRLVLDDEHAIEDDESVVYILQNAKIPIRSDDRSALMHHKFLIIDGTKVWMGSMNFTFNGIYNNNNNALFIESVELAANYQGEFDEMFDGGVFATQGDLYDPDMIELQTPQGNVLIETYFSPEDGEAIEARLAELIRGADNHIYVMAFSFTLDSIGDPMIERFNRGVDVRGVFETTGSLQGVMLPLLCAGVDARQDGNPDTMHHKVFIIDDVLVTGSFNFSASARDRNSENLLIIHSAELAEYYVEEFNRVYNEGRSVPSENIDC